MSGATSPLGPDDLLARLAGLGIDARTYLHAPVFTVQEAKGATQGIEGTHCKNLFLVGRRGGFWLVVMREEKPLDLRALAEKIGAPRLSFASPETMGEVLGVRPGAVSPFATVHDAGRRVRVVLDRELLVRRALKFHPLVNDRTTVVEPDGLLRFLDSTGHVPTFVDL